MESRHSTAAYITPFVAFVSLIGLSRLSTIPPDVLYLIRFSIVVSLLLLVSRHAIPWPPRHIRISTLAGVAVFAVWILPDLLWPGYRAHWLFTNFFTGSASSSVPAGLKHNLPFIFVRAATCAMAVPILEELFWRGWLMRWLIQADFEKVPLGAYAPLAFWLSVALFASEHGRYWDVGLLAGIAYNWLMVRTRNLADCILAHAVTNACLSAYVLYAGQWQYWL